MSIESESKQEVLVEDAQIYINGIGNYDTRICQALSLCNGHRLVIVTGRENGAGKGNL
jgi:hypothetical protein